LTMEEAHRQSRAEMHQFDWGRQDIVNRVAIIDEMPKAKRVKNEAKKAITEIMGDIKMGKQVEVEKAEHVVELMVDSVFRNVDALTSLSRIKDQDSYLFMHSVNVCVLMISFCRFLGIERETINKVGIGALLHDIGKTNLPLDLLNKADKLTEEEFAVIQKHSELGRDMLLQNPKIPEEAVNVAYQHHERYDGTGYPNGLKGDKVSQFGQMASIVDVYDAITSDRVYHKGMEPAEAIRKIFEWSKHHFKEELCNFFIKCVGIYPVGTLVRLESGLLAVVVEPGKASLIQPVVRAVYDVVKEAYIHPKDFDLSRPGAASERNRIVGYENPAKHGIKPLDFLDLVGGF
jgi:putative nucleotidyltransferase with HDIG domain